MLKMYPIKDFIRILKQQNDIHKYVLKHAESMHFTPFKLIKFERIQIKHINELNSRLHQYDLHDIVTISTKTDNCKITRKNCVLWKNSIDHNIIERC